MKTNCISCGREINLNHKIFHDYAGPVKCFCCGAMMEIKSADGVVYAMNPHSQTSDHDYLQSLREAG